MTFFKRNFLKLSPIAVLVGLMMGGMVLIKRLHLPLLGAIMAGVTEKIKVGELVDCSVENVKSMQLVFFILMFAYAMAKQRLWQLGVGATIVNVALGTLV